MRTRIIAVAFAVASLLKAGADGTGQETIPLTSPVYADMDALYLATGAGTPSNARPWTKAEALLILSRIDRPASGTVLARLYDLVAGRLEPGLRFQFDDGFQFGAALDLALEGYGHTNADSYALDADWPYGFEERRPMARLALDFGLKDFLYVYSDLQYGRNRFSYLDEFANLPDEGVGAIIGPRTIADDGADSYDRGLYVVRSSIYSQNMLSNVIEHSYDFDFEWPKRAVATVGGADWNVSLARDKISWGNGHSGNFIVDNHVDFQEYVRATAFSDYFKYDWLNVLFPTNPGRGEEPDGYFRVLMAHRLEFRVLERFTAAISEDVMYRNDLFDLRYLNPAFIYHNLNDRSMFNAIAHLELDWAAGTGWNLYAQYVLDQARAPNESAAQGNAMGYIAGIEYAAVAGPGLVLASLEGALTDPLLYRRDGVDFLMFRQYFCHGTPEGIGYVNHFDYIGYPYGGDAQVLRGEVEYRIPGSGEIRAEITGMRHGAMDFFTSHSMSGNNALVADYEGTTPSGNTVTETLWLSLSGRIGLPGAARFHAASMAWAQADWLGRRIYDKAAGRYEPPSSDLQVTLGLSLSL